MLKHKKISFRSTHIAIASLAALNAAGSLAGAAGGRSERSVTSVESRAVGEPIMAIVSLRRQQILDAIGDRGIFI
jgi:hypothetical protein